MAGRWEPPSSVLFASTLLGPLDMGAPFSLGSQLLRGTPIRMSTGPAHSGSPGSCGRGQEGAALSSSGRRGDTQGGRLGREGDSWGKMGDGPAGVQGFCGVPCPGVTGGWAHCLRLGVGPLLSIDWADVVPLSLLLCPPALCGRPQRDSASSPFPRPGFLRAGLCMSPLRSGVLQRAWPCPSTLTHMCPVGLSCPRSGSRVTRPPREGQTRRAVTQSAPGA